MDNLLFESIKNKLNKEHYVMNDSWLIDCVRYYLDIDNDLREEKILMFVKSQWQLHDLREINNENGSLPKNLAEKRITTLPGSYILQVNKIYDIGTSKYKQLEQLRNVSTVNIDVTEKENSKPWESAKKRMYQLFLTDGVQDICAIEYSQLHFSTEPLLPGYKILIKGPVKCRRGVILLEQKNFKEIGGEVENLLIKNATENVLAGILNLPLNDDPYKDFQPSQPVQETPPDNLFEDEFNIDLETLNNIEETNYRNQTENHSAKQANESRSNTRPKPDNELLDLDDNILQMIDESDFHEPIAKSNNTINASAKQTNSNKRATKSKIQSSVTSTSRANEFPDDDFDFSDFEVRHMPSTSTVNTREERENLTTGAKRTAQLVSPPFNNTSKIRCVQSTPKVNRAKSSIVKNQKTLDSYRNETLVKSVPSPEICDFLCQISKENVTEVIVKTVQGKIVKVEKLQKKPCGWHLEGTIDDTTATLDVMFSPQLLEEMFGFSVKEFSEKKKLKNTNPAINDELRTALRKFEMKIKTLDALLDLEFSPGSKPKIIKVNNLTSSQRQMIQQRLKLLKL